MKRLLSLIALSALFAGCTYAGARVDFPDGTTVRAKYLVLLQNRSLSYDPKTGAFYSEVNSEPAILLAKEVVPLAKAALVVP